MFYNYCKNKGHTIDKCYKLHGYPSGNKFSKGKKFVGNVQSEESYGQGIDLVDGSSSVSDKVLNDSTNSGLSKEQFGQLMGLLSKLGGQENVVYNEGAGSAAYASMLVGKDLCLLAYGDTHDWIVDSGASDHITPDLSRFDFYSPVSCPCFITMPNCKRAEVQHIGTITISPDITLHHVLHVPDFQFNLLSVMKLTK